ncbi:MAG: hypothetical protein JWQ71_4209 [Pedosphaera sp.]|nr:hypothetical protein [Pedosphaera sp.]
MSTFDPTKPANNSPVSSAGLRNQLNALEEEIPQTAYAPNSIAPLNTTVSNPPAQAQVQAIADKIDEMLSSMSR